MFFPHHYWFTELCVDDLAEVMHIERLVSDFPWCAAHFEDSLRYGSVGMCIRHAKEILCGYCVWMPVVDEIHLLNLCVAPDMQRKGLGLALLERAVQYARTVSGTRLLLEVSASNQRARHFYRRFGFTEIGFRKNYYRAADGLHEDAYVMHLILSEVQHATV